MLFILVFVLYYVIRVESQLFKQVIGCCGRVDANPMPRRLVVGVADAGVLRFQFIYALRLALERDDTEVVAIEE